MDNVCAACLLQLLAESLYMSVNSAGFSCELIAPYTLHELFSGENNVPVLEHAQQQLELLVCKLHVLFAHSHLVLGSVKNEATMHCSAAAEPVPPALLRTAFTRESSSIMPKGFVM